MAGNAFTAGVRPGGLTSVTEIRILLCYLVKTAGPLSREILQDALLEQELVNYFELASCLDDLASQDLVVTDGTQFAITENGARVAENLSFDLPRTVREKAINAVLRLQAWTRKAAENQVTITPQGGSYRADCSIVEYGQTVFSFSITLPDHLTAERVKQGFIENGAEIYVAMMEKIINT